MKKPNLLLVALLRHGSKETLAPLHNFTLNIDRLRYPEIPVERDQQVKSRGGESEGIQAASGTGIGPAHVL